MDLYRHQGLGVSGLIKSLGYDLCPDKPCVYKRRSRTSGGGLIVLHLEDIPFIKNNDG